MMLNMPKIPEKIKTCYNIESVKLFIPNPFCCYKYQRYVHHEEKCNSQVEHGRYGGKDPDYTTDQSQKY